MCCQYVYVPSEHDEVNDIEGWSCPRNPYSKPGSTSNFDYCIFHIPIRKKKEEDITAEETQKELLKEVKTSGEENKKIIGGKLRSLSLKYLRINSDDHYPIDLSHTLIDGPTDLSYCSVNQPLILSECTFNGELLASKAKFSSLLTFSGSHFCDRVSFAAAEFNDEVHFDGAIFEGNAEFLMDVSEESLNLPNEINFSSADFHKEADFSRAEFKGTSSFQRCLFNEEVRFSETEFEGLQKIKLSNLPNFSQVGPCPIEASFHSSVFKEAGRFSRAELPDRIDFRGTNAEKLRFSNTNLNVIFLGASEIGDITMAPRPKQKLSYASFGSATIDEGVFSKAFDMENESIRGPEDIKYTSGEVYYSFHNAKLGDIDVRDTDEDLMENALFRETEFDGFNFTKYRSRLSPYWNIHSYSGPSVKVVTSSLDHSENSFSPNILENTYLNAKNGARKIGDGEASSQFLIKEMRYRRSRWWNEILNSQNNKITKFWYLLRWLANSLTDIISVYGEKPRRVVWVSLGVLASCTLLYPLSVFGGISGTENGQSIRYTYTPLANYNFFQEPFSFTAELASLLQKSLYFSVVTFTTLGYGDLRPVGWLTETIASLEAFVGSFLIAFFVFSLGKQINR